jgi:phosphoribosyl 1,2-cyclic phosphodiesterase
MQESRGASHRPSMQVRFWGVRGSIPTPAPGNLGYGGNTSCVEVLVDGESFIFDAGTGIRNLGIDWMTRAPRPEGIRLFLTHFHWDHLQGLPFFQPLYDKRNGVSFHSPRPAAELPGILRGQMAAPYFPVHFDMLPAKARFARVGEAPVPFGQVEISSFALTHPEGSSGYRLRSAAGSVVYAADHEHGVEAADRRLLDAAKNARVLIYDAQFTPEEYPSHVGWGHGTWLEAVKVAEKARVEHLVLFHHDPERDDDAMDEIVEKARGYFPNTVGAREGAVIDLG